MQEPLTGKKRITNEYNKLLSLKSFRHEEIISNYLS